jgi:hypothetical protein
MKQRDILALINRTDDHSEIRELGLYAIRLQLMCYRIWRDLERWGPENIKTKEFEIMVKNDLEIKK